MQPVPGIACIQLGAFRQFLATGWGSSSHVQDGERATQRCRRRKQLHALCLAVSHSNVCCSINLPGFYETAVISRELMHGA